MSQVTITDIKDVRQMTDTEIDKWIASHERSSVDARYVPCVLDDLDTLRAEKTRRAAL